jgi:hypothetical protein
MAVKWLTQLQGAQRAASGLEWTIWRKLPLITVAGTLAIFLLWLAVDTALQPHASAGQLRLQSILTYVAIGAVVFHWTMVLTLAIGCAIVIVMKGPGYVADAYALSHGDHPAAFWERSELRPIANAAAPTADRRR